MKFNLKWEIMSAAELICNLPANMTPPKQLIDRIYSGSGMRYMHTPKPRKWQVRIVTKAKADDGNEHTHRMTYIPDSKVGFSQLMGFVEKAWIAQVDEDLAGFTAISAHATAEFSV